MRLSDGRPVVQTVQKWLEVDRKNRIFPMSFSNSDYTAPILISTDEFNIYRHLIHGYPQNSVHRLA